MYTNLLRNFNFFLHTSRWSFIIAPNCRPTCTVKVYSILHRCRRDCNWFLASVQFIYQFVYNKDSKLKALVRSVAPPYAMNNICEATTIYKPPLFPFFPLSLANTLYSRVFPTLRRNVSHRFIYIVYETSFFVECANRFWVSSGSDHWPGILSLFHTQKSGVLINKIRHHDVRRN